MRLLIHTVVALVLGYPVGVAAQDCTAPEVVLGAREYNALVCEAVARYDARDYASAVTTLRQASVLRLHEYPNFRVLPRLALAEARLGHIEAARRVLAEAALSFEVYYRISRCRPNGGGFDLARPNEAAGDDTIVRSVVERMCGEAFEAIYDQAAFDGLVTDLPLVEIYAEARAIVSRASLRR